jgi:hypothetical protein
MARKRRTLAPAEPAGVTAERFTRLYRLIQILGAAPASRETLARRLHLDVRGFYRDLEFLRAAGIGVNVAEGRYSLEGTAAQAHDHLPFPDPHLNLGEARALAKGRGAAQRKLSQLVDRLMP